MITASFTYVATAEVIGLLGLTPVLVDVDANTFQIDVAAIERKHHKKNKSHSARAFIRDNVRPWKRLWPWPLSII